MLGRDIDEERGNPGRASSTSSMSSMDTELMGQATRCVRKFAPEGRKKMRKTDNGHVTACKISDANPNEMIASWSGQHIYSFDLVRSPSADEQNSVGSNASTSSKSKGKVRESTDRKRKRKKAASTTSLEAQRQGSKTNSVRNISQEGDMALRVRYENGQSEDIAMSGVAPSLPSSIIDDAQESVLTESQKRSSQIAKRSVKIRKLIFSLEASASTANGSLDPAAHCASFTSALGFAASCLTEMKQISRNWRYPINPLEEDVIFQQTLRRNRNSSQRFVQAAGTLARALGGKIQVSSHTPTPALDLFLNILPIQSDGATLSRREAFSYTFLKAIILWLDGGSQALLQGFKKPTDLQRSNTSFPISDNAEESAIHEVLIPYLLRMAGETAIPNVDASRFERDETRKLFATETAAVIAFSSAIRIPLKDLSRAIMPASPDVEGGRSLPAVQDKETAVRYWGFKVGRGLLINVGEGVDFQYVDIAFGGLGVARIEEDKTQDDINPEEEDRIVDSVSMVQGSAQIDRADKGDETVGGTNTAQASVGSDIDIDDASSDAEVILVDDLRDEIADHMAVENERTERNDDNDENDENDGEDSDDGDDDGDITAEERSFMFRSASDRGKLRERVEKDVPCHGHTRTYRGHCNVKTVKDANFFGLQDEYVVSGSDDGHLFIWDKKTSQLVNILEGDSEVVNVAQGMPLSLSSAPC